VGLLVSGDSLRAKAHTSHGIRKKRPKQASPPRSKCYPNPSSTTTLQRQHPFSVGTYSNTPRGGRIPLWKFLCVSADFRFAVSWRYLDIVNPTRSRISTCTHKNSQISHHRNHPPMHPLYDPLAFALRSKPPLSTQPILNSALPEYH
jgi:hypothetical protein